MKSLTNNYTKTLAEQHYNTPRVAAAINEAKIGDLALVISAVEMRSRIAHELADELFEVLEYVIKFGDGYVPEAPFKKFKTLYNELSEYKC